VRSGGRGQALAVRVGPLATREEADRIAARLKTKEKPPTCAAGRRGLEATYALAMGHHRPLGQLGTP
jgi:hypothetical protein